MHSGEIAPESHDTVGFIRVQREARDRGMASDSA